tara:strand:+ start:49 stop:1161 length:1113 start_codon:yes stop_codon:yes gene_type:complete
MKVLFLTPHLSTSGMPQFLLKRIEAIKQYTPDIEVFVYEWEQTTINYTVQRDKIVKLVGDNFFSCGYIRDGDSDGWAEKQNNFVKYCYKNKIDIIHTEDIVEYFIDRDYNPNKNLLKQIYDSRHPWKIVETPHDHNKWVYKTTKYYKPDGYVFVIDHKHDHGDELSTVIEYPIDNSIMCSESREEILEDGGWRTTGEYHIVNVGLWQPDKNQKYAIELARKCWDKYGWTYIFHFVGNQAPNFKHYWEPLMENLPPNVKIHGEKDTKEVSKFYKMSDLLLFPSDDECSPLVLKEGISNNMKIMAFNLKHYGDVYINYIEALSNNINDDFELLLDTIHGPRKYNNDLNQNKLNINKFANAHKDFYELILKNK